MRPEPVATLAGRLFALGFRPVSMPAPVLASLSQVLVRFPDDYSLEALGAGARLKWRALPTIFVTSWTCDHTSGLSLCDLTEGRVA